MGNCLMNRGLGCITARRLKATCVSWLSILALLQGTALGSASQPVVISIRGSEYYTDIGSTHGIAVGDTLEIVDPESRRLKSVVTVLLLYAGHSVTRPEWSDEDASVELLDHVQRPTKLVEEPIRPEETDDPVILATVKGSLGALSARLRIHDPGARDKNGWTALHFAAARGLLDKMELLLSASAQMDAGDADGYTPLIVAIGHRQIAAAKRLIRAGANVSRKTQEGYAGLHYAALLDQAEIVRALIAGGASIESRAKNNQTPLLAAAAGGSVRAVRALLDRGANPYAERKRGGALAAAAMSGNRKVVELLLTRKLDQNTKNLGLAAAAAKGRLHIARVLLANGADPSFVTTHEKEHLPIVFLAAGGGYESTALTLVDHGASVHVTGPNNGSLLHLASIVGMPAFARRLVEQGVKVHTTLEGGHTSLHLAASEGHVRVAELLLASGADIEAVNDTGETPLLSASSAGHLEVVKRLLSHEADVKARNSNQATALLLADTQARFAIVEGPFPDSISHYESSGPKIIQALLRSGADPDAQNLNGQTALQVAAVFGDVTSAQILVLARARLDIRDTNGRTPWETAQAFWPNDGAQTLFGDLLK